MKYFIAILILTLSIYAGDGTPAYQIWKDLGIKTAEEYYYLSGFSGMLSGHIFAFILLYLIIRK